MPHIKIRYIPRIFLIGITCLFFLFLQGSAKESDDITNIKIFPDVIINEHFYGFGAETLPWLWTEENKQAGVSESDIELNVARIRDMRLPITRIFVPWETWNPKVDYKTFTWQGDEMKSLCKTLDLYQGTGTSVILVTVDWLEVSPWKNIEKSSRAVLELLEYLIKERGYSCIQFWTLTNEPELTYGWLKKLPFKNYIKIHKLVNRGLKRKGLPVKILASDEVESLDWFKKCVRYLYRTADVFSFHAYFYPKDTPLISDIFEERFNVLRRVRARGEGINLFLCEFGFRDSDFSATTNSLMEGYEYGLYTASLCTDVLNSGIDNACIWCLHQIRLIDEIADEGGKIMRIGLWGFKDKDWKPFPVFYVYRLFTKYIKGGSVVLKTEVSPQDSLKAACVEYKGKYSLIIVNTADIKHKFIVKGIGSDLRSYLYRKADLSLGGDKLLKEGRSSKIRAKLKGEIPPRSVIFYTNI